MKSNLTANELRNMYLDFFRQKGHKVISGASLIPENDPTVLFTTAGMHPLVPYLLGEKHPEGKRITNVQKCVRTGDIESVGDATHCTFFEMLGNWSFGDYFKEEAIKYSWEFLSSDKYLGIPKERLFFTVFEGDEDAPKDMQSYNVWRELEVEDSHIYFLPKEDNWWGPAGLTGPCGPDTEMFYDTLKLNCSDYCRPGCSCGKYVEIWNNVFMEYNKLPDGTFEPLKQYNVDTGMGLERILAISNNVGSIYETELYKNIIAKIEKISGQKYNEINKKEFRVVAEHCRAITFILGDERGISPSNADQGYVLRRLIRRTVRYLKKLGVMRSAVSDIASIVIEDYANTYPELEKNKEFIIGEISKEEQAFNKTINQGIKEFNKIVNKIMESKKISSEDAFRLYDTFGFPIEFTMEMGEEQGIEVDYVGFEKKYKEHQELSRTGSEQKFKGGLADNSVGTMKLHTATHLLQGALRKVLRADVSQRGSNITTERLRFDFSFERKLTSDELKKVECIVNDAILQGIEVKCEEMTVTEAKEAGAIGLFDSKYGDKVKVYSIKDYSKEICGGPHASNTKELGVFEIMKEESSSTGVRRIKARLR
ncbi:MAG TPA: alanine--tRNA ligase [Clostridiales bacterium]|nr:MAG: alanine--tRNA ligase [Clostridiales bacterium GWD2_32_19]HCC07796.1 alanine--tRNA ligase [Clostridiales bacterium]